MNSVAGLVYMASTRSVPTGSAVVDHTARPSAPTPAVPSRWGDGQLTDEQSSKLTWPVGRPGGASVGVTVAVRVTTWPVRPGFGHDVRVVVVVSV